jgi:hypothetical protein
VSTRTLLTFCFVLAVRAVAGSPLDEIRSASRLENLDLQRLKRGDVVNARGPLGGFQRGVYTESCYFVRAPITAVASAIEHWDPTRHRDLEVSAFREYSLPSQADVFNSLTLNSSRREDRWLIDKTADLANASAASELHLTSAEIASVRSSLGKSPAAAQRDAKASEIWCKILHERSDALANGGLAGLPSYRSADAQISARSEFASLLKLAPAVAARFAPITNCRPFSVGGSSPDVTVAYWEASQVRGHTGLHSGVLCARKAADSWQVIDVTYYTSDTYFMSASLYEMWPLDEGTIVWQTDFVSAPFGAISSGIERVFGGREMLKESEEWIRLFRGDIERR